MKIEPVACFWMIVCAMNFSAARNVKKLSFSPLRPNLRELGLFVCKLSFIEILMINIFIWIKISRFGKFFDLAKNGNNTSILRIPKSNSISFMLNNSFYEMNSKKVTHGGDPGVNWGNIPNFLV